MKTLREIKDAIQALGLSVVHVRFSASKFGHVRFSAAVNSKQTKQQAQKLVVEARKQATALLATLDTGRTMYKQKVRGGTVWGLYSGDGLSRGLDAMAAGISISLTDEERTNVVQGGSAGLWS